ncbi:MAG: sulfite exporter TauE/SafE family protein [Gammaproteobacteria bacterium]|nr:sulfite exporter TauE/SafE family protein [Gammaproteobacteria bacterium]
MEWWQPLALAAVGLVAGWMNVLAGGGSMLTIPAMVFMGVPGPVANGTNRLAIAAQNIVATATFLRADRRHLRLGLTLGLAAMPGAAAGALLGARLEGPWFNRALAVIMVLIMILMARRQRPPAEGSQPGRQRLVLGHLLMVGAGAWGGFIQIGVGFILMPILHRVLGLDLVRVNMHKVLIVLMYIPVTLAIYAVEADLLWAHGAALALGNAVGGWAGAHTNLRRGEGVIRVVLYIALAAIVIRLIVTA